MTAQLTMPEAIRSVSFQVLGDPASQGSKTTIIRKRKDGSTFRNTVDGRSDAEREKHRTWRSAVAAAARDARADLGETLDGPLEFRAVFRFAMPASRPKFRRLLGIGWKSTTPDLGKVVRSTEDALKIGGLIADDSRIARQVVEKVEVLDAWIGVDLTVSTLTDETLPR